MRNGPAVATSNFTEFTHKAHRGDYVSTSNGIGTFPLQQRLSSNFIEQDGPTGALCESKLKHLDNPFIDSGQKQTIVDMKGNRESIAIFLC